MDIDEDEEEEKINKMSLNVYPCFNVTQFSHIVFRISVASLKSLNKKSKISVT